MTETEFIAHMEAELQRLLMSHEPTTPKTADRYLERIGELFEETYQQQKGRMG